MDIILFIPLLLLSIIPSIYFYKWLKKQNNDEAYQTICKDSLKKGILSILYVLLTSAIFFFMGKILKIWIKNELIYEAYYNFITLAFVEELVKYLTFKKVIKTHSYSYSWLSLTVFMMIVGLGFGCIENFFFAIGSNLIAMAIRGVSMGHVGYGFIMGWFYGKMLKTKKKIYGILSFLIPWLLHGLYDFGLSDELIKLNDNFAFISITLELICIIYVFIMIRFVKKRRNDKEYLKPLKLEID